MMENTLAHLNSGLSIMQEEKVVQWVFEHVFEHLVNPSENLRMNWRQIYDNHFVQCVEMSGKIGKFISSSVFR